MPNDRIGRGHPLLTPRRDATANVATLQCAMGPAPLHEVRLLGRPALRTRDGAWSDLKPGLTAALLGYLAFESRWVERGEIAALVWPDRNEEMARANLRPLLWRLAHEPMPVGLERERTRVRWPVRTDHAAFVAACRAERWKEAWALRGELLAGVRLPHAPEFETWLEMERATVQTALRTAGLRAADAATRSGDDEAAAGVLDALYRADTFDEAVLRALAATLARRGSGGEALAILAKFERLCREELGGEPQPATRALEAAIRAGRIERTPPASAAAPGRPPVAASDRRSTTLPVPLTPFVGRGAFVAAVSTRIVDPACRVLTLVGPGGVGKTRIAIEVARQVGGRFEAGARFVELAAVSSEGALIAAIAGATDVGLAAGEDPRQRILRVLQPRQMLLVLDNAEHLDEAPALVAELAGRAPRLKVLITSRRATGLPSECIVDVAGLEHADPATSRDGRSRVGPTAPRRPTESADLFVQVATRAGATLTPADGPTIERLCASLGGLPLAIELAAAWSRVLSLDQIEAELTQGLDLLRADAPARASRHASMRVVFEHAWAMLHPRERAAMRRLVPFRGGFSLHAAKEAASITLPVLLALVNKSFLRRSGTGRFHRHPLVWRYARERADEHPEERQASRDRHAAYYLAFLAERRDAFQHADGERMMLEIDAESENVAAAWRWACMREQRTLLRTAVSSLGRYCSAWGRFDLQDELLPPALEVAGDDAVLRGLLLAQQGSARTWRAAGDLGVALFDQALDLLASAAGPAELALALRGHANAHTRRGHRAEADASYARAASLYRQLGDVGGWLMMDISRGGMTDTVSDALARLDVSIGEARAARASHALGMALTGRVGLLLLLGEHRAAEAAAREAQTAHAGARTPIFSLARRNLRALVCIERGRLVQARALCCRILAGRGSTAAEVEAGGDAATVAMAAVARAAYLADDHVAAKTWGRKALEHHRRRHGPSSSYDLALCTLVRAALATGDVDAARRLVDEMGRGPDPSWLSGWLARSAVTIATAACQAEVALAHGDDAAAAAALRPALARARSEGLLSPGLGALVPLARILDRRGARLRARRLARFLGRHPRASFETRRAAARLHGAELARGSAGSDHGPTGVLAELDRAIAEL
jgi:predicted ATPase/DNA-binding SARP family transcriptional activator